MKLSVIFCLLVVATLCMEVAMNLPMGSLPLILDCEHVPQAQIAVVMGCASATIVVASIPVGALVDRFGRLLVMKLSTFFAIATLIAMAMIHGAVFTGMLMSLRALATLCFMTAQAAYVSVLVPKDRSVSAVATMGILGSLAFASSPAFAVWMWDHGLGRSQFLWASLVIAAGSLMIFRLPKEHDFKIDGRCEKRLIMRREWIPAIIFGIAGALQGGVNTSLAVLAFQKRGIANGAALFTAAALTTVALRYPVGRMVERFGPRKMALPTAFMQAIGCFLAVDAHTLNAVIFTGISLGCAWAGFVPIVLALLFERSSAHERGSAMGIFNFALGLGFTLGAALATGCTVYASGYSSAISLCAMALLTATPVVLLATSKPAGEKFADGVLADTAMVETCIPG